MSATKRLEKRECVSAHLVSSERSATSPMGLPNSDMVRARVAVRGATVRVATSAGPTHQSGSILGACCACITGWYNGALAMGTPATMGAGAVSGGQSILMK